MSEMIDRAVRVLRQQPNPEAAALGIIKEMRVPAPEMLAAAAALPKFSDPVIIWETMIRAAAK